MVPRGQPRSVSQQTVPEGIRITKVGLWYVLFTVLVGVAATNTGNNALYLVLAAMLALFVVSGLVSRHNLRGLEVDLETPGEVFAHQPFALAFTLRTGSRWLPRWLLLLSAGRDGRQTLIPFLARDAIRRGKMELLYPRRGPQRIDAVHVSTLFPMGFFRKGLRYRAAIEVLVFPELYGASAARLGDAGRWGEEASRRSGWGHDLHVLRAFRAGDDPRGIHWKQTARTGTMIFTERELEESRRLSIVLDNGVGALATPEVEARFERLVSEAATAAVDHLARGFEVELVTRDRRVSFGGGPHQRFAVLEALALVGPRPRSAEPLAPASASGPQLRLSLEEAA